MAKDKAIQTISYALTGIGVLGTVINYIRYGSDFNRMDCTLWPASLAFTGLMIILYNK